jgi:hypothetical protein
MSGRGAMEISIKAMGYINKKQSPAIVDAGD